MKLFIILIILISLSFVINPVLLSAQTDTTMVTSLPVITLDVNDSLQQSYINNTLLPPEKKKTDFFHAPYSKFIIPTAFVTYGILTRFVNPLEKFDHNIHYELSNWKEGKVTSVDDYLQYVPVATVFALDLAKVKAKHNFRDQVIVTASSYLITAIVVQTVKKTTAVARPDSGAETSFPSGHTATAFTGAQILFREYKDTSPWIGVAGYTVAATTGILRMINKRHWFSDVITGAGIGMLSVEVSYLLLPVYQKILGIKNRDKSMVMLPIIGNDYYGAGMVLHF